MRIQYTYNNVKWTMRLWKWYSYIQKEWKFNLFSAWWHRAKVYNGIVMCASFSLFLYFTFFLLDKLEIFVWQVPPAGRGRKSCPKTFGYNGTLVGSYSIELGLLLSFSLAGNAECNRIVLHV